MQEKDKRNGGEISPTAGSEIPNQISKQKILIVDDRKANLVALRNVLSDLDVEIIEATSGNEALAATLDHSFSLAILDVKMPEMDGYELAEHLRGDIKTRNLPIIFLTAVYSAEERIFEGYKVGAVDYIVKPYTPIILLSKVRVFLDLARAREELAGHRDQLERLVQDRVREIRCLYALSSLIAAPYDSVDKVLTEAVNLIPSGFQYPESLCARITFDGRDFVTPKFRKTPWQLTADIPSQPADSGASRSFVQVCYLEDTTDREGRTFIEDERRLLDDMSRQLALMLQREYKSRDLRRIKWLLSRPAEVQNETDEQQEDYLPTYGDLTALNSSRLILDSVGKNVLIDIVNDYLQLLDTSAAVYEKNGDYAIGIFSSGWCRCMDEASYTLCGTDDHRVALESGRWHCHESCWTDVSKVAIESGAPVDIQCKGGIRLYAAPIFGDGAIIGAINFGYGDPPNDETKLGQLATAFDVNVEDLRVQANSYQSRPPYIIDLARQRLEASARLIGEIVRRKKAEDREQHLNAVLRSIRNVNRLIVKERRWDALIQNGCDTLISSRGFQGAWIALLNASPDHVEVAQAGFNTASFESFAGAFQRGELPACCRRSQGQMHPIAILDPPKTCQGCSFADAYPGNAALTVGLQHDNRHYGYMGVCVQPEFAHDEEETSLIEEIANDIAFALHSMEIENERKAHEKQLELRNRIMKIMITISDEEMFAEVLSVVQETMESEFGVFGYINKKGDMVCPTMTRDVWEKCSIPDKDIVFPRETWGGIWGRAMVEKRALYSNKPFKVPEGHIEIKNAMDVPVVYHKELIGNFIIANKKTDYNEKDVLLLETVAENIAPILAARLQRDREEEARAKFQAALKKSEKTLKTIFDNARDGILLADAETRKLVQANEAMIRMLGYGNEELTGLSIEDIHPSEDLPLVIASFEKQLHGEISLTQNIPVKRRDGNIYYADVNSTPFMLEGRRFVLGIFRDVTERRNLEEQLLQSQKMEAIGTLAGGIAHDFNNILGAIIGFGELARTEAEIGTSLYDNLTQVLKGGYRARDLVKQILTFSRQSDKELIPVNTESIVKEALKLLRSTLPTTMEIRQSIEKDLAPVLANPGQIHQILMNLCTNAAHAMGERGGILEVDLREVSLDTDFVSRYPDLAPGPFLRLTVSDTGCGISPEIIERIFEPYFTTKAKGVGTGMGLAVVQGIVKEHGGEIAVCSEVGQGTTFRVYLPQAERVPVSPQTIESAMPTGNEEILFIDDEPSLTKLAEQMLGQLGYAVTTRTSSIEALELVRNEPDRFDLVMTDMTMPNMTGDQLAKEIMRIRPDLPIILCTGFSEQITKERAAGIGVRAFIMKPLAMRELAEEIREVLDY